MEHITIKYSWVSQGWLVLFFDKVVANKNTKEEAQTAAEDYIMWFHNDKYT